MDVRSASCKIAAALLIVMMTVCCIISLSWADESDAEVVDSGTCGPSLHWEFDDDVGYVTISGTGDMDFSASGGEPPWKEHMGWITTVNIGEGVTSIADGAFYGCTSLFEVINQSSIDIQKGSTDNGYVAYYARNVFSSGEEPTVGVLNDTFVYGFCGDDLYVIKYIAESTYVEMPDNMNDGEYIICRDFYALDELSLLTVAGGTTGIEEHAFGDFVFYDIDGTTELEPTADNMRGSTFMDDQGLLVKQVPDDPSTNTREMPLIVLYIATILSVGIIIHVLHRY